MLADTVVVQQYGAITIAKPYQHLTFKILLHSLVNAVHLIKTAIHQVLYRISTTAVHLYSIKAKSSWHCSNTPAL
jgi:hypothetical protein